MPDQLPTENAPFMFFGAGGLDDVVLIDLPSSSPAHARPLEEKRRSWSVLAPYPEPAPITGRAG